MANWRPSVLPTKAVTICEHSQEYFGFIGLYYTYDLYCVEWGVKLYSLTSYTMSPISDSGVPAWLETTTAMEAGVRTPGSKDLPLTIEADDDDLDEDLPPAPSPTSVRYPRVGVVKKKKETLASTAQAQIPGSSLSSNTLAALLARPSGAASATTAQPPHAPGNASKKISNRLYDMTELDWELFKELRAKRQKQN